MTNNDKPSPDTEKRDWRPIATMPEGREYWTLSPGGQEQKLRRQGSLYFGGTMYVYYTPTHWSPT